MKNIKSVVNKHELKSFHNSINVNDEHLSKQKLKEKGVTITSLVVTIIVLLILAGITIKFALDDNGIIKQSRLASEKYQNKALQEQLALNQAEQEIDKASNSSSGGSSDNPTAGGNSTSGGSSSGSSEDTDELKKQIEDLQNEVDSLTNQIQREQQEKEKLQQQVNDLKKKQNETNATISDLNNQIKDKDSKISDLTKEKSNLESQINTLKSKQATGNATASQVLAGATFSNSSGVGLKGTMLNHSGITTAVSVGSDGSKIYLRTTQGAYLTNSTTGYPEVCASISDINNITGYKYTQSQYDSNYNAGYSNGQSASRPNVSNFKTAAIGMDQYGAHSGTVSFPSNGYVFITGAIINKRQTYGGRTAILHVQLSGSEVASAGSTSNSGVEDGVGLGNFNTSWLSYTANSAIYAYVDGSIQRMSAMVRIGFVPAS